ncbi:metallophosphoesterase N-terminal domain-containing protein [Bacteroides xylanisolvens]|uniref:metallophosphoesterase N-terminal domain-containing protein n=1 Tax=Bacteroides xylanisolvens TaxID=371601 RepID=UPI0038D35CE5
MKIYLLQFFLLIGLGLNLQAQIPSNPIRGKVTCNGTGVPGVVVTDGIDCVLTDQQGQYTLPLIGMCVSFIYPLLPDIYRKQNKQYLYSIRS